MEFLWSLIVIVNSWFQRAPTKAKPQEPAYSQALNQNKIDRQRSRYRESGRQAGRQAGRQTGYGRWCLELRQGGRYGKTITFYSWASAIRSVACAETLVLRVESIHSFILAISIAPLQVLYYSQLQHGYCIGVSRRSAQATAGKGLAQGPYMAARSGVEPTTLRLKAIDSTKAPPCPINPNIHIIQGQLIALCRLLP